MSRRVRRLLAAALLACAAGACKDDPARREYFQALELEDTGQPLEDQLRHLDRAVHLAPTNAHYREKRGARLFSLGRVQDALADYDRAVALEDRPYLRFERADALCALAEYEAASADLDHAIAAHVGNVQFSSRRALVRLALGRVADARADVDRAFATTRPGIEDRYARAAVLVMEGELEAALLEAEPDLGPHYWLTPRNCANGFIAARAGELVSKAQPTLAALPRPSSRAPVAVTLPTPAQDATEPSRMEREGARSEESASAQTASEQREPIRSPPEPPPTREAAARMDATAAQISEARARLASLSRDLRLADATDFAPEVPADQRQTALSADLDRDGRADLAVIAVGARPSRHEYWLLRTNGSSERVLSRPGGRVEKPMELKPAGAAGMAARRYGDIVPGTGDDVDAVRDGKQKELERRRAAYRSVPALVVCTSSYDLCGTSTTWYFEAGELRSFTAGD
ncbi:MAG: tetratricopeptide repeat protein [Myxococcota bacterium]|nr:tetratricopeptide repeat protein [Myxococcota bacterium]